VTAPAVTIAWATAADRGEVLAFLDRHWQRDHVFVRRPALLDWQHGEPGGGLNLVLARAGGDLAALLGYVPARHFDPALPEQDVLLAIWKVRDDVAAPGLGLALLQALRGRLRPRFLGAVGLSAEVVPIYRALGFTVGRMDHHVLFAAGRRSFAIASGVPAIPPASPPADPAEVADLAPGELDALPAALFATVPARSPAYLAARYADHPVYRYRFSALRRAGRTGALLVWRAVAARGGRALRVVDLVGDDALLAASEPGLQRLLAREGAEYLDVVAHGLSPAALAAAGFVDRRAHPGLVVPGHFEPFAPRNVDLDLAYRCAGPAPVRLLRGDGDQDRPNR